MIALIIIIPRISPDLTSPFLVISPISRTPLTPTTTVGSPSQNLTQQLEVLWSVSYELTVFCYQRAHHAALSLLAKTTSLCRSPFLTARKKALPPGHPHL